MSEQVEQVEQYDDVCPDCGMSMGATHAPWCEFPDGTPVPKDCAPMIKARCEAEQAILKMAEAAPDYDALMWAAGELLERFGVVLRTIPITSDHEIAEKYFPKEA